MSSVKANNLQIGQSVTATNNATWYQPASPDGTVRLGVGNAGATTADVITASSTGVTIPSVSSSNTFGFKNRIINGGMVIDQRNAGASVSIDQTGGTYTLDRWYGRDDSPGAYSIQQVSDAPTGFKNSLKITITATGNPSASQYGFIGTWIEGLNCSDLAWGTSGAITAILSFWVKSSVTGQFGGSITNGAQDRAYPFSFTINAANTWEQKSVTITGDTSGTWLTTNGAGIGVNFAVGIGSNFLGTTNTWVGSFKMSATGQTNLYATSSATLQFTGVQLEVGSQATSFDFRSYGQELALCQRYYAKSYSQSVVPGSNAGPTCCEQGLNGTDGNQVQGVTWPVVMRAAPSTTVWSLAGTVASLSTTSETNSNINNGTWGFYAIGDRRSRAVVGNGGLGGATAYLYHWAASAEL